jgi:hypothetical protein
MAFNAAAASDIIPEESSSSNPYSVISDRNIFHLNPAPPPQQAEPPKALELPKIMLTGFVGKGSSMKVLLAIPPTKDSKEGMAYLSLSPGDRDHDVQLVKIHLDKEEVDIINAGTAQTLSAKSNSYAALAANSPPGGGVVGAMRGGGDGKVPGMHRPMIPGFNPPVPQPGGAPAPNPSAANYGGGGSSVIAGGGSGESGAIVSGGGFSGGGGGYPGAGGFGGGQNVQSGGVVNTGNEVGNQIANSLLNGATPRATPARVTQLVPVENQGPTMILQKATTPAGNFPPLPPNLEQELQEAQGGGGTGQ